ncbi:3-phenylpropionate/trans-cinnamate dioxygenase ferredoxin reductase subunit [Actinomadura pelletieri DSM 43383]|uniref:3-phenylpropionate/trans-cinnamate dioxygenase ferredoxin reductase subunit n=1 Tax=Actinomadura pelletieri DSM 43383 TaxID=1120940 RepID=A0A495QNR1_9ACTN|nr:FAD-dependent oxidoreductase [Actinomadura pelletieri]RKS74604.1 3-phenylpropionate/trans-cinnamate dioxygenase ferredoxin reductase subunit [Actinomadura pelletieri DSM 43383]
MDKVIVVGGGLAGLRAVEALRGNGHEGALTLVSAERYRPYDRPPLSKAVLAGETDDTTVDADWDVLRCELLLGERATGLRLDPAGGVVASTAGDLPFDGLVIATGAVPITLPGDGRQHVLRTIDDARDLRSRLVPGARIVIVGAGWIGAEVATAAAKRGCSVTVIEAADTPLAAAIGTEVGAYTAPWYEEAGVELRTGVKVAEVRDGGLVLAGGDRIDADEVVVGVGVRPELSWLDGSGLLLERGVVTDGSFRAYVGAEEPGSVRRDVVAVGDCASWWSARYGRRLLVEHWDVALNAPEVAAASLLGQDAVYDAVPYFWSEQFGRMVQYAGSHASAERIVHRGDPSDPKWAVAWLTGDRLDAILTVDRPRDLVQARRVIAAGTPVDPAAIADPDVPVRQAVRG